MTKIGRCLKCNMSLDRGEIKLATPINLVVEKLGRHFHVQINNQKRLFNLSFNATSIMLPQAGFVLNITDIILLLYSRYISLKFHSSFSFDIFRLLSELLEVVA